MYTFTDPIYYHLTRSQGVGNLSNDFQRIIDYLITFVGEVSVDKQNEGAAIISYADVPFQATLKTLGNPKEKDKVISDQITLTCEKIDNLSVHLVKNVTNNIGYRIYNAQTKSFLVNDPNILDLTVIPLEHNTREVFEKYKLTPLFQYRDAQVYFAKDKTGHIHLVNRHLLEYLKENPTKKLYKDEFSVVVAKDIGRFVALFDRGLIPLAFHKYIDNHKKIINLSGFDIDRLQRDVILQPVYFYLDLENQSFSQTENGNFPQKLESGKGKSLESVIEKALVKFRMKYLAIKIAQDIGYIKSGKKLIPRLTVSVFLDSV